MKKNIYILLLSIFSLSPLFAEESKSISFFFLEICPSCDEYKMAYHYADQIRELDKSPHIKGQFYNMIDKESQIILKETLTSKGLPDVSRSLPLLIIEDQFFNGYEEIGEALKKLQLQQP